MRPNSLWPQDAFHVVQDCESLLFGDGAEDLVFELEVARWFVQECSRSTPKDLRRWICHGKGLERMPFHLPSSPSLCPFPVPVAALAFYLFLSLGLFDVMFMLFLILVMVGCRTAVGLRRLVSHAGLLILRVVEKPRKQRVEISLISRLTCRSAAMGIEDNASENSSGHRFGVMQRHVDLSPRHESVWSDRRCPEYIESFADAE